jgi:hypothetical protein
MPQLVLLRELGVDVVLELETAPDPLYSQLAAFTDRDKDGDADLFLLSEFGGVSGAAPSAFFRNDGLGDDGPVYVNDAEDVGADAWVGGMGFDSLDLNGDDVLDYCIVQFGPIICLASSEVGYIDTAVAMGLVIPELPPDDDPEPVSTARRAIATASASRSARRPEVGTTWKRSTRSARSARGRRGSTWACRRAILTGSRFAGRTVSCSVGSRCRRGAR